MQKKPTPREVIETVCSVLNITHIEFISKSKELPYVDARFIAAYLIKVVYYDPNTFCRDFCILFNRNRKVVSDQRQKCAKLLLTNPAFKNKYEKVLAEIKIKFPI